MAATSSWVPLLLLLLLQVPLSSTSVSENPAETGRVDGTRWPEDECGRMAVARRRAVNEPLPEGRVVGGRDAQAGEVPWQVSVQLVTGWASRHACGGAVVAVRWVVSAAHCAVPPGASQGQMLLVVAGDHYLYAHEGVEQRVWVARVVTPGFHKGSFERDLALLQLHAPLRLGGRGLGAVVPICLPGGTLPEEEGHGLVSGWGRTSERGPLPPRLRIATLPLVDTEHCRALLRRAGFASLLAPCQLCAGFPEAGGADACQADSGGPLACPVTGSRFVLCGIVSWGVGCGRVGLPGVYTRVACYVPWIRAVMERYGQ